MTPSGVQGLAFAVISPIEDKILGLYQQLALMVESLVLTNSSPAIVATAIRQEIKKIESESTNDLSLSLPIVYNTAFHWTIVSEQVKAGIVIQNHVYNENWCQDGKTFRERILVNNENMLNSISSLLMVEQKDNKVLLGLLEQEIEKGKNSWLRLVRTEAEAAYSQGVKDALIALGYLYAVVDNPDPCDRICAYEVGERLVTLAEVRIGLDLPPYHPNCKCVFRGIWYRPR